MAYFDSNVSVVKAHQAQTHALKTRTSEAWFVAADAWEEAGYPMMAHVARFAATLDLALPEETRKTLLGSYGMLESAFVGRAPSFPIGFPTVTLERYGRATTRVQPQITVRPRRLVIEAPRGVLVEDIRVGNTSFMVASQPISASVFAPNAFPIDLAIFTCQVGQSLTINLSSEVDQQVTVRAIMFTDEVPHQQVQANGAALWVGGASPHRRSVPLRLRKRDEDDD